MAFESERRHAGDSNIIEHFVRSALGNRAQDVNNAQRWKILTSFCSEHKIKQDLAHGLNRLLISRNATTVYDMQEVLKFALWLSDQDNSPANFPRKKNMVYLADKNLPLSHVIRGMKANCTFWTSIFGPRIFGGLGPSRKSGGRIWKSEFSVEKTPGYYFSVVGGSGSGTFSLDLAIGFDPSGDLKALRGQMWRVGMDVEVLETGERILRIIRTGSGFKKPEEGSEEEQRQKKIRKSFLDVHKVSPQRLLLFLALQIAYDLGFEKVRALSTEGGMELSTLKNSKHPIDYTSSMLDVGFTYKEGNWHEINDLQNTFYEIFGSHWHEDENARYDVHAYSAIIDAFNTIKNLYGESPRLKLASNPHDLEAAWRAFAKIHTSITSRAGGMRKPR